MSVNLTKYSAKDIIDMVNGTKKRDDVKDDTGIYQIGVPKNETEKTIQNNVAILSNMKQMLVLDKEPTGQDYRNIIRDVVDKTDKVSKIKKLDEFIRLQLAQLNIKLKRMSKEERKRRRQLIRESQDKVEFLRHTAKKRRHLSSNETMISSVLSTKALSTKALSTKALSTKTLSPKDLSTKVPSVEKSKERKPEKTKKTKSVCESPKNSTSKKRCARNGNCCVISG
jgi:uncharacterized membrane protein